jgi:hypothetical protein
MAKKEISYGSRVQIVNRKEPNLDGVVGSYAGCSFPHGYARVCREDRNEVLLVHPENLVLL